MKRSSADIRHSRTNAHDMFINALLPKQEGVGFSLQQRLKHKALIAKVQVLLQEDPLLLENLSALLLGKDDRSMEQLNRLRSMMSGTTMFGEVDDPIVQMEICRCMTMEIHGAKADIIKEGDVGDRAFVLLRGFVSVYTKATGNQELARLRPVHSFGDLALKADVPRNASCVAVEDGTLVACLSRKDYRRLLVQSVPRQQALKFYGSYFGTVFDEHVRINLAFATVVQKIPKGSTLTQAGQTGAFFYFIQSGSCSVVHKEAPPGAAEDPLQATQQDPLNSTQKTAVEPETPKASKERSPSKRRSTGLSRSITMESTESKDDDAEDDVDDAVGDAARRRATMLAGTVEVSGGTLRRQPTPLSQNWMSRPANILLHLTTGDFFGAEAVAGEPSGRISPYAQTVISDSRCVLLSIPLHMYVTIFPKEMQRVIAEGVLAMARVRGERSEFLATRRPQTVADYGLDERLLVREKRAGRGRKVVPVKTELKYVAWKAPERDMCREARCEDDPIFHAQAHQVNIKNRTFVMNSSICLQFAPSDLLRPVGRKPRALLSLGFGHEGPKQKSPPGTCMSPGVRELRRQQQRVQENTQKLQAQRAGSSPALSRPGSSPALSRPGS